MSIFKRRKKEKLEEFCSSYYEEFFFGNVESIQLYNDLISDKIAEVDPAFKKVSPLKLIKEVITVRLELFALAWYHEYGHKKSVDHSVFTKNYLIGRGDSMLWEAMQAYNQAIAKSALIGYSSDTMAGRVHILDVNKTRVDLFREYQNETIDNKCIARAINRYGTKPSWERLSLTLGSAGFVFCENLGYDANDEAAFIVMSVLKGFYDGPKQTLEDIKIEN